MERKKRNLGDDQRGHEGYIGPVITIEINGQDVDLTHLNTSIHKFLDAELNHIRVRGAVYPNRVCGIPLEMISESFVDRLSELNYPESFRPVADRATEDWYVSRWLDGLSAEAGGDLP